MDASPIFDDQGIDSPRQSEPSPGGYRSEAEKTRYWLIVGSLAGLWFIAQNATEVFSSMGMTNDSESSLSRIGSSHVRQAVSWNERIWYREEFFNSSTATLCSFHLGEDETARNHIPLTFRPEWLLPAGNRLWLVSKNQVGWIPREPILPEKAAVVQPWRQPGTISSPFLDQGMPAVLEFAAGRAILLTFQGGDWMERGEVILSPWGDSANDRLPAEWASLTDDGNGICPLQIVSASDRLILFTKRGKTLWFREGLPLDSSVPAQAEEVHRPGAADDNKNWRSVGEVGRNWLAMVLNGEPVIFRTGSQDSDLGLAAKLTGSIKRGHRWHPFFEHNAVLVQEFGGCPLDHPGRFAVVLEGFVDSVQVLEVQDGTVVKKRQFGEGMGFVNRIIRLQLFAVFFSIVVSLMIIIAICWCMARYRVASYRTPLMKVSYAPLWRRGVAHLIDSLLDCVPIFAGLLWLLYHVDASPEALLSDLDNREKLLQLFLQGLAWFGVFVVWTIAVLVALSYWIDRSGRTPGKCLTGIEVVGTDWTRCGCWRALVRNLLILFDAFYSYMVGILLIAFTTHWQRLGDMAAKTVVIRSHPSSSEEVP